MLKSMVAGAIGGVAGTFAMSPLMAPRLTRAAERALPPLRALDEFPPRRVVQLAQQRVLGGRRLASGEEVLATWVAHIGYGTAMGALYGALHSTRAVRRGNQLPAAVAGVLFGLGVWAAGYAGWLPLIGMEEGTVRGDARDLPFPFAAHIVYGAATGAVHGQLR